MGTHARHNSTLRVVINISNVNRNKQGLKRTLFNIHSSILSLTLKNPRNKTRPRIVIFQKTHTPVANGGGDSPNVPLENAGDIRVHVISPHPHPPHLN